MVRQVIAMSDLARDSKQQLEVAVVIWDGVDPCSQSLGQPG